MFFNPGNVSNSVVDIISIISPLLSDATFDIASNKIIFTKKNGETFELDLSSLKGLTREEINSMIINLIASTVETISFDNDSNNLVITKKGGTSDSISLDNFLEEEDLDNLKSGTDSTINPTLALYVKATAPDYQSVKNSGYNTVASSDIQFKHY